MPKPRIKNNIFVDSNGNEWSADLLQDLVDALNHYREFYEIVEYHRNVLKKE